jgi:hypothetical protein
MESQMAKPVQSRKNPILSDRFQRVSYNSSTSDVCVELWVDDLARNSKVAGASLNVTLDVPERLQLIDVRLELSYIEKRILAKSLDILRRLAETGKV